MRQGARGRDASPSRLDQVRANRAASVSHGEGSLERLSGSKPLNIGACRHPFALNSAQVLKCGSTQAGVRIMDPAFSLKKLGMGPALLVVVIGVFYFLWHGAADRLAASTAFDVDCAQDPSNCRTAQIFVKPPGFFSNQTCSRREIIDRYWGRTESNSNQACGCGSYRRRSRHHRMICGTKRELLDVIGVVSSLMPIPAGASPTIQQPSTGKRPSKFGRRRSCCRTKPSAP
jgi:hypothetical protein